jgi:hypothetical protein
MKTILLFCASLLLVTSSLKAQTFEWAKSFGSNAEDAGRSVSADASWNVYTAGHFQGTVDFDPGEETTNLTSGIPAGFFVQKLDSEGNFLWAKSFGATGTGVGLFVPLAVDDAGNTYIAGNFSGTVDFDPGEGEANLTAAGEKDMFIQKMDATGNFLWVKAIISGVDWAHIQCFSITLDTFGNLYTIGHFGYTYDFDPGESIANLTSSWGNIDIFIQKLDTDGNFIWAKSLVGNATEFGYGIVTDALGNIYTAGLFTSIIDLDPGPDISSFTSAGGNDAYVQKLDSEGNYIWGKTYGGAGGTYCESLAIDAAGNVYTSGTFEENEGDYDPGDGIATLTTAGFWDIYVHKLDAEGNFVWVKSFGGPGIDKGRSIALDGQGNIYTTGYFRETTDFDPGEQIVNLTADGSMDIFIQKMDEDGNFLGALAFGSNGEDQPFSIFSNQSGNIYAAGYFQSTADFDPGETIEELNSEGGFDVFVLKLNQNTNGIQFHANDIQLVYPNPASQYIKIGTPENAFGSIERITITDASGRIVWQSSQVTQNMQVDVSHLAEGVYTVVVQSEESSAHRIFLKIE